MSSSYKRLPSTTHFVVGGGPRSNKRTRLEFPAIVYHRTEVAPVAEPTQSLTPPAVITHVSTFTPTPTLTPMPSRTPTLTRTLTLTPTPTLSLSSSSPSPSPPELPTLPLSLRTLGNASVWTKLLTHVTSVHTRHEPVVVWGPTGCGKTCGVRDVAKAASMQVVEMDGAEAETTAQLIDWITRIRDIKLMQGRTLLLIDDFESFTTEARSRISEWMRKTRGHRHLCPMVVTCTNVKEPSMRSLHSVTQLRLFAPDTHTCRRWFQLNGFEGTDGVVHMPTPSSFVGSAQAEILASCDLRRIKIMLQWKSTGGIFVGGCGASAVDLSSRSTFESTRRLFLRRASPCEWARHAQPQDVDLLREHALKYVVADDVDALARVYDTLSLCDASRPMSFTSWEAHLSMPMHTAALGVALDVCATKVDALFPCSMSTGRHHASKFRERALELGSVTTTSTYVDMPAVLRSEWIGTSSS